MRRQSTEQWSQGTRIRSRDESRGALAKRSRLRRLTLEQWLSVPNVDSLTAAGHRTRIRMIESHTSTNVADPGLMENRLGLQCIWDHPIRGKDALDRKSTRLNSSH